jgi:hypothetical protein
MAEVVEHLPSKCEVLSLSPVLLKKKKRKEHPGEKTIEQLGNFSKS